MQVVFLHKIPGLFLLLCLFITIPVSAEEEQRLFVEVDAPYVDIHTGPGRGYPVVYVAERGEIIEILSRRTDWFKVRTSSGKKGYIDRSEIVLTLDASKERLQIKEAGRKQFASRKWEFGLSSGEFEGAPVITSYGAYHFTENLSTEITLSQVIGSASSSLLLGFQLVHEPFPDWRVSPFFTIGTGIIDTQPKSGLVATEDRQDNFGNVGIGMRLHLTKRFLFRAEYKNYVIFTSRNDNEEIEEWKLGFAFFF